MSRPWEKFYTEDALKFDAAALPHRDLVHLIDDVCAKYGPRPAATTILPNGARATISYAELQRYSGDFAAWLREVAGVGRGDTVAVMTPNCVDFAIAICGIFKAGCRAANVNPLYTAPELEHQLKDSGARVLVIVDLFGAKADAVAGKTGVEHVVTLSLLDFMPPLKKRVIGFVMKRVKKVLPGIATPHTPMTAALVAGARARAAGGIDVASHAAGQEKTDTAVFQYTSGTTGRSKGAELSHLNILTNAYQARAMTAHLMNPSGETALVALPLYHITAFVLIFIAGLIGGGHAILVPSPRPPSNLRAAFEAYPISWFTGINTLYAALMAEPWFKRDLCRHMKFCGSGGAAQHVGVARRWQEMTGLEIYQGYGMTECAGVMSLNPIGHNRLGSVGIPVPGLEVRIVDDGGAEQPAGSPGELLYRGASIMKGYFGRPAETAAAVEDGWLRSGDIAVMDEEGFLQIVDRKKDMILVSGFNVSPNEIEDVIARLDGVVEVGVIGVPDERSAEVPKAFVVSRDPGLTAEAVIAHCRTQLTNYKVPKQIEFVAEIPKSPVGKVLRRELRKLNPPTA